MKQTFLNKYFDWILIFVVFIFSLESLFKLFENIDYISLYFVRICFLITSILTFFSFFIYKLNGEKYSRFFIIMLLILPLLLVIYKYLFILIFHQISYIDISDNIILVVKFIIGIILLKFSIKFSRLNKLLIFKEFSVIIICLGIFITILCFLLAIDFIIKPPRFRNFTVNFWILSLKILFGLMIIFLGYLLNKEKIQLKICLLLVLTFIIGYLL